MLSFNTDKDFKDNYKFLIGSLVPRPIAWVSTLNDNGTNNLAPFSFFTAISAMPMIVAFSPLIRTNDGKKKDTVINIEREKEFVINFCPESMVEQINECATELEYGKDEFALVGVTPIPSEIVQCKRVLESPIHFECKLKDIISYGENIGSGRIITGDVVKVHVEERIYNDGRINTDSYRPIGRGAGVDWVKCDNRIQVNRKTAKIE